MNSDTITLDVRDDIRAGREPFSKIMETAAALPDRGTFLLIAPFKPVPLFDVLKKQGFHHTAEPAQGGDWRILFTRHRAPSLQKDEMKSASTPEDRPGDRPSDSAEIVQVDARGLEPPQPLVRILEALANLPANSCLRARTDRKPMHLYAQLEERGFASETEEQTDGTFLTHIRRR